MIVSSNKTFSAWAEIFGDPVAVAAMVDRLAHHAEVVVLGGDSYRLKGKTKEVRGSEELPEGLQFRPAIAASFSAGLAALVRKEETVIAAVNFVILPLTFLSSVFMAQNLVPGWIRSVARFNPVNWAVVAGREALSATRTGGSCSRARASCSCSRPCARGSRPGRSARISARSDVAGGGGPGPPPPPP